jgi:4-hydroxy-tetrahydrodipicolinate synthase
MKKSKKGFIPVMLTPFKNDGSIDYRGLKKLTELYIESGASGLFANCLSSEMFELSEVERIELINHVIKTVDGAIPVVATGTFGGPLKSQADFVKKVYDTGVDAVIGITGLLAEEQDGEEIFEANVEEILRLTTGIPFGFYECPVPYKRVISPEQLGRLVNSGRVTYHKDTCLDIEQIKQKIASTQGHNFGLYDAYMGHAVKSLEAGAAGLSCIQGNFFPELIVWLCNNYDNPLLTNEVNEIQNFFIENMDVMHNVYPVISKYALQSRGLDISTFVRRGDIGKFDANIKMEIDNLINRYASLTNELELKEINFS